jgi:hypothetical protein
MKKLMAILLLIIFFTGCKKIINVDLQEASSQLVIEGLVTNSDPASVTINKSVVFSSDNVFPPVTGAVVNIADNSGNVYSLKETAQGNYTNQSLIGVPGKTYNLTVSVNGAVYTASSTMPKQVNLDTLLFEQIAFGSKLIWIVKPQYFDPPDAGNHYKFIEKINNVRNPTIWVWDDKLTNNGISTRPLIQQDSVINIKDTVEVDMQCIDRNIFKYFATLQNLKQNSATPANPDTNISGGVLGYFSAHTSQKKKAVVKK